MAGWGGARVGAGKKPKRKPVSPFAVFDGGKPPDDPVDVSILEPPSDLSPAEQSFWRIYAPLALKQGTFIPEYMGDFRLLCEVLAKKAVIGTMVDKGALGGLRVWMQLVTQADKLLGRFCLAPFGKPAKPDKPKREANPFAAFGNAAQK